MNDAMETTVGAVDTSQDMTSLDHMMLESAIKTEVFEDTDFPSQYTNLDVKDEILFEEEDTYCCDLCPDTFSDSSGLKHHISSHHTDTSNSRMDNTGVKMQGRQHSESPSHTSIITWKSPTASKDFKYEGAASPEVFRGSHVGDLHLTNVGNPCNAIDKPHQCRICMKTFAHMRYLKTHMIVHSDDTETT